MSTISNEELIEKISGVVEGCQPTTQEIAMATELLALRKEREAAVPVYQERRFHVSGKKQIEYWAEINKGAYQYLPESERRIVYAAPPAQPVAVPVVPAAYEINADATDYHRGWNACRATMLAAPAQPVAVPDEVRNRLKAEGVAEVLKEAREYAPLTAEQWMTLTNNFHGTFIGLADRYAELEASRAAMLAAPGKN